MFFQQVREVPAGGTPLRIHDEDVNLIREIENQFPNLLGVPAACLVIVREDRDLAEVLDDRLPTRAFGRSAPACRCGREETGYNGRSCCLLTFTYHKPLILGGY
ncbi:MAG: hypothetical protein AAGJ54_03805 [Planctomycetota bacterium]